MNRTIKELVPELVYRDVCSVIERELPWEQLDHKRIMITGANGFISYYLVLSCLVRNDQYDCGITVYGLVRSLEHAKKKYGNILERDDIHLCVQDVCDAIDIEKVDYIIHAASQASAFHFENDPVGTINANLLGTQRILELARKCEAEVLMISSLKVYGSFQNASQDLIKEEDSGYIDQISYKNCYAMGKRAAETLCASYSKQYDIPIKIVRPSYIYGPTTMSDDRVWAQFIANVIRNEDIVLKSNGAAYRSYCYVTDTVAAIFTVLVKGKNMQPYNISSEKSNISIRNFARAAVAAFPERKLRLVFERLEDEAEPDQDISPKEILDNDKIKCLGWDAYVTPIEGIRRATLIMEDQYIN